MSQIDLRRENVGIHDDSEHAGSGGSQRIARPTVLRGEDLGRNGVQHPVHDLPVGSDMSVISQEEARERRE